MNARWLFVAGAAGCALLGAVMIRGPQTELVLGLVVLGGGALITYPRAALALMLLTLSFDQFLNVRVADAFNVRLAHACAGAVLVRMVAERLAAGRPWRLPRRLLQPLGLYFGVALLSVVQSANLAKSVGYLGWAAFDVLAVFAVVVEVCREPGGRAWVVRWWVAGALLAAGFGLVQLALGIAHLPVPLAEQHLGAFPRINGFNFEPSYFAFYLESVAAVLAVAWARGALPWGGPLALALLIPAALSMSRSGWLGMGLLTVYVSVQLAYRSKLGGMGRAVVWLGTLGSAALLALPPAFISEAPKMAAMALDAKEASSTAPRLGMISQAQQVFRAHPLLGVGLGGYGGFVVQHPELLVHGQMASDPSKVVTTHLWLEVAAETGLAGVFALLWFLAALVHALWRAALAAGPETSAWCEGLLVSVLLVFAVLYNFNQTLWRLDVWVLLALAWAAVERAAAERAAPALRGAA